MTISHLLEDFGLSNPNDGPLRLFNKEALEEVRLSSFEKGYSAGWEDGVKAGDPSESDASAALVRSIEDMSFTFHEVRAQMIASLEPFFSSLTQTVLPEIATEGLNRQITSLLSKAGEAATEQPVVLFVAPGNASQFQSLVGQNLPLRLKISEDSCLGDDQVILRLGPTETELDGRHLLSEINALVETFIFEAQEEIKVG